MEHYLMDKPDYPQLSSLAGKDSQMKREACGIMSDLKGVNGIS
jgi:hypothetical protein